MKIIKDQKKLENYIKKFKIDTFFTDYESLMPCFSLVEFPPKSQITFGDKEIHCMYFIVRGRFKVYGNLGNGKRILYRFCSAFMAVGDMEFLEGEHSIKENTVEPTEDCLAVVFDYRDCKSRLMNDPKFLQYLCLSLAEKFKYFGTMQMVNTLQSADARLASYILNSAGKSGVFCENQRIVAEHLNISYRHLHRILHKFVEKRYLEHIGHCYRILNAEALKNYEREQ